MHNPWTTVSASQLSSFTRCQRKWWFTSVARLPTPQSGSQSLGTEVHAVLENYLVDGTPVEDHQDATVRTVAKAMIKNLPPPGSVARDHVERSFTWRPEGFLVPVRGVIDLVATNNVVSTICDHKTTSNMDYAKTEDQLRRDPQAIIYCAYAAEEMGKPTPMRFSHNYGTTRSPIKSELRSVWLSASDLRGGIAVLAQQVREMDELAQLVDAEEVPCNREACGDFGGCPFAGRCAVIDNPVSEGIYRSLTRPKNAAPNDKDQSTMSEMLKKLAALRAKNVAPPQVAAQVAAQPEAPQPEAPKSVDKDVASPVNTPAEVTKPKGPDAETQRLMDQQKAAMAAEAARRPAVTPLANTLAVGDTVEHNGNFHAVTAIEPNEVVVCGTERFYRADVKTAWEYMAARARVMRPDALMDLVCPLFGIEPPVFTATLVQVLAKPAQKVAPADAPPPGQPKDEAPAKAKAAPEGKTRPAYRIPEGHPAEGTLVVSLSKPQAQAALASMRKVLTPEQAKFLLQPTTLAELKDSCKLAVRMLAGETVDGWVGEERVIATPPAQPLAQPAPEAPAPASVRVDAVYQPAPPLPVRPETVGIEFSRRDVEVRTPPKPAPSGPGYQTVEVTEPVGDYPEDLGVPRYSPQMLLVDALPDCAHLTLEELLVDFVDAFYQEKSCHPSVWKDYSVTGWNVIANGLYATLAANEMDLPTILVVSSSMPGAKECLPILRRYYPLVVQGVR